MIGDRRLDFEDETRDVRECRMDASSGLIKSNEAASDVRWNIGGQICVLKHNTADGMAWHATFPAGSAVPPHVHTTQDEYFYVLEGVFHFMLAGKEGVATPGDMVSLPKGIAHSYQNKSDHPVKALFGVTPTGRAYEMFWALHNLGPSAEPADLARTAAAHEVDFLPSNEARS
jgi:quercetin dioxygenase-like cupin family protein